MALNRNPPPERRAPYEFGEQLGFVRLYLDDLEALVRLLRASSKTVVIGAGRAVAEEAADLKSATPKELEQLVVETDNPKVRVSLTKRWPSVSTFEDSDEARNLVTSTRAVLTAHEGGKRVAMWKHVAWTMLPVGVLTLIVLPYAIAPSPSTRNVLAGLIVWSFFVTIVVVFSVWIWRSNSKSGGARIILLERAEQRAARSSTVPIVWATLGGAVLGSLLTVVVTRLLA